MKNSKREIIRNQSHAGSWYHSSDQILGEELTNWLKKAGSTTHGPARAIITPHAGYKYSGECASYAFKEVDPNKIKRIFIFGPSHYCYVHGCLITSADEYQTPFYNLIIDKKICQELEETKMFKTMSLSVDVTEHSIEMQLPYIAKVMDKKEFTIVPILVGSLDQQKESIYGKIFSKYLKDDENLFVISSDFCHWGTNFDYQYYEKSCGSIHKSIEKLDKTGMDLIEKLSLTEFKDYLKKYNNTICGRNPIILLLSTIEYLKNHNFDKNLSLKFLKYAQSNKCTDESDFSVSYAAASLVIEQ